MFKQKAEKKVRELVLDFQDLSKGLKDLEAACLDIYRERTTPSWGSVSRMTLGFIIPMGTQIGNIFNKPRRFVVDVYADEKCQEFSANLYLENVGRGEHCEHLILSLFFTLCFTKEKDNAKALCGIKPEQLVATGHWGGKSSC